MKYGLTMLMSVACFAAFAQKSDLQKDLDKLPGNWEGQLTYTDYKDDKTNVQLPATVSIKRTNNGFALEYIYTEPNGKQMKNPGGLRVVQDSSIAFFDGKEYDLTGIHRKGARLTFVLEREDQDNDRNATIRKSFTISDGVLNILKEVKYEGADKFFVRNRLTLRKL